MYEYGRLTFSIDMYRFMYPGGPVLGEDYENHPNEYEIFNRLAKSGWEPLFHFDGTEQPTWIMRRLIDELATRPDDLAPGR